MSEENEQLPQEDYTLYGKPSIELIKDLDSEEIVQRIKAKAEEIFKMMEGVLGQCNIGYFHFCCLSFSKRKFMKNAQHANNEIWSSFKSKNNIKTSDDLHLYFIEELRLRTEHTRYFPSIKQKHDERGWLLSMISKQKEEMEVLKDSLKKKDEEIKEMKLGKRNTLLWEEKLRKKCQENDTQVYRFDQLKKEATEHKVKNKMLQETIKKCRKCSESIMKSEAYQNKLYQKEHAKGCELSKINEQVTKVLSTHLNNFLIDSDFYQPISTTRLSMC